MGKIIGIACVDTHWALGKTNKKTGKGELLFNLKEDLKFFRDQTRNQVVVMGENTLLSLPESKPLKGRINIVICQPEHEYENCICVHSFEELLKIINIFLVLHDVYICGGGMVYRSMLPYYDEVKITKVDAEDPEATVFFPNLDKMPEFRKEISHGLKEGKYALNFLTYYRK